MKFELDRRSVQSMRRNVDSIRSKYPTKVRKVVRLFAEVIMTDSKEHYCPVDEGTMKNTGGVTEEKDRIMVTLAYGDGSIDYVIDQHQNPTYVHEVGSWKFLETPFKLAVPRLIPTLAAKAGLTRDLL